MYTLLPEQPADADEVENLYDLTFAPGRTALSSYRLRDGVPALAELSRVARDEAGIVAGAIRFWPVRIGHGGDSALLLGPVAVHPTRQGEGLGGLLIWEGLDAARAAGWARVLLVGDAPYYRRFGFNVLNFIEFPPPTNPDRVMGQELQPGAFAGVSGLVRRFID
ncbi:GNAT family N-acetyltransferase [Algicella marina]|uniref:GNAT family N-acetyltransferase n=1 Tax=Algicella marina TaxID=2683284 RepID=A0A6P1SY95_9RHOB|nr:N-acetyltransferase [Algicella marina]QHQ35654.1 GNAT family N-acetyltransferase [Algicella marina]